VDTNERPDGSVVADIRNGQAGSTVSVSVPKTKGTSANGVTLEKVDVKLRNGNSHFKVSVRSSDTRPSSVQSDPADVDVKGYLQIDKQFISNADIEEASIGFRLSSDRLSEYSSPKNVVLYRYHDGAWQELETTFVRQDGSEYVFEAVTPGFSVFAIGEKQPDISVSGASLQRSSVAVGETVEVTAEVTNDGAGVGNYTAELTVAGEVVASETVTVPGGETKTVTFSYTPSEAGSYDVTVDDASAGTLDVTAADQPDETTTTATTTTTTGPADDSDDGGSSGLLIALLVLVVLGGLGGALYYFRDEIGAYLDGR
jgi:PGF-pre-PGF domain-containing protein